MRGRPIRRDIKKTYSRIRWPNEEPVVPGLREDRKPKQRTEAVGFLARIISEDQEDDESN